MYLQSYDSLFVFWIMTCLISNEFVILWFSFCILNHDRFYFRWMYCQLKTYIANCDRFYFRCIGNLMILFLYTSKQDRFYFKWMYCQLETKKKKKIVTGFISDVFVILWFSFCILNYDRFYFRWMYCQLETWKPIWKF